MPSSLSPYSTHLFTPEAKNNSWSNMYHYIPQGARVLDVGCSTGNFGEALEQLKACTVVGIDISEADIAEAQGKISEAHVLDITAADVAETLGRFDVVIFADVLEHLVDPRSALRAVHSLLNDGGIVVYSIPHMGHWSVRLDLLEGRFPYTELGLLDRTHLHFYDRVEIHDIFAKSGFRINSENPTVSGYPESWVTERLAAIGVVPEASFFGMLKHTEAHVYQYVGTAVPHGGPPASPGPARDEISPPDDLLNRANQAIAEKARVEGELHALRTRVADFRRRPVRSVIREIWRRTKR